MLGRFEAIVSKNPNVVTDGTLKNYGFEAALLLKYLALKGIKNPFMVEVIEKYVVSLAGTKGDKIRHLELLSRCADWIGIKNPNFYGTLADRFVLYSEMHDKFDGRKTEEVVYGLALLSNNLDQIEMRPSVVEIREKLIPLLLEKLAKEQAFSHKNTPSRIKTLMKNWFRGRVPPELRLLVDKILKTQGQSPRTHDPDKKV